MISIAPYQFYKLYRHCFNAAYAYVAEYLYKPFQFRTPVPIPVFSDHMDKNVAIFKFYAEWLKVNGLLKKTKKRHKKFKRGTKKFFSSLFLF